MPDGWDVMVFYGLLVVWSGTLVYGFRTRRFSPFVGLGVGLALALNVRYFIEGPPDAIAFFIGIYDTFDNIGLSSNEGAAALASCPDNACTVWGDRYLQHPSWGVAFYDRFANASDLRTNLLYGHIAFNSIAFVLMHLQLARPGVGADRGRHQVLGRLTFAAVTIGTFFAVWLASQHGDVDDYGGILAQLGFYSMSMVVYGTAIAAAVTARRGDVANHRIWSIRFIGSMWGSFWLFRAMLIVTGPLLRGVNTLSIQLSIWLSAPLGVLIADVLRRRGYLTGRGRRRKTDTAEEHRPDPEPVGTA